MAGLPYRTPFMARPNPPPRGSPPPQSEDHESEDEGLLTEEQLMARCDQGLLCVTFRRPIGSLDGSASGWSMSMTVLAVSLGGWGAGERGRGGWGARAGGREKEGTEGGAEERRGRVLG